jgi:hypothetical protein
MCDDSMPSNWHNQTKKLRWRWKLVWEGWNCQKQCCILKTVNQIIQSEKQLRRKRPQRQTKECVRKLFKTEMLIGSFVHNLFEVNVYFNHISIFAITIWTVTQCIRLPTSMRLFRCNDLLFVGFIVIILPTVWFPPIQNKS